MTNPTLSLATLLALVTTSTVALAEPASPALRADVEVDPTAYVLDGYSVHAGIERGRWRLDLGAFALALPASIHGNDGFSASFDGFGAKLQYFVFAEGEGGFVGVDASMTRLLVQLDGSDDASRQRQVGVGVNLGWRFPITHGVYATPWLGLGRTVSGNGDGMLGGRTFTMTPWTVFPAVHVGRRF